MFNLSRRFKPLIFALAIWLAVEPITVSILHAQENKPNLSPKTTQIDLNTTISMDEIMTPVEYLDYLLELRGLSKEEAANAKTAKNGCEAKVWADWMQMLTNVYSLMEAEQADVFSFYSAFSDFYNQETLVQGQGPAILRQSERAIPRFIETMAVAAKKTNFLFAYLLKYRFFPTQLRMLDDWLDSISRVGLQVSKHRSFQFLELMSVPTTQLVKDSTVSETEQYFRWVRKVTTSDSTETLAGLKDFQGVARTLGIGMTLMAVVLDCNYLAKSSDIHAGRFTSWNTVSTCLSATLEAATLICMFVPGGQIVALSYFALCAVNVITQMIGNQNRKWKEAYKNSYWFLYESDPVFRSFYINRGNLKPEEKCASQVLAEKNYGAPLKQQVPQNDEEKKTVERGKGIFESLEKQGVLMSYYAQNTFSLPDFDIARFQELWKKKADYMSWKPTEEELKAENNSSFFGKVLDTVNPANLLASFEDNKNSSAFKNEANKNENKLVYFNPDFVLIKKFQNYLMGKNLKGGLYDVLAVRIEQSPFNYIPLLGINSATWNDDLLNEAFQADSLIVGTKELSFFTEQIKEANKQIDDSMDNSDQKLKGLQENFIPNIKKASDALKKLMEAYRDKPNTEVYLIFSDLNNCFGWQWDSQWGLKTPASIIANFREEIEKKLQFFPLCIGQMAVETVMLAVFAKHVRDTVVLMKNFLKEKRDVLAGFDNEFKNEAFRRYLIEGSFLDIKGSSEIGGLDWFSGMYPAFEELRKQTELLDEAIQSYSGKAQTIGSTHDKGWLFWKTQIKEPNAVLSELNQELEAFQKITEIYEKIGDSEAQSLLSSDNQNVYPKNGFHLITDPNISLDLNAK
ncbi:MAG: hypothetical protein HQM08_04240 [Candidatus Riflebacteria bacterium]|nr:hypothetical protein [Candidatus Riflebacteria bacterium]